MTKLGNPGERADIFTVLEEQLVSQFQVLGKSLDVVGESLNVASVPFLSLGELVEALAIFAIVSM